jgi:sugar/nucleoside kinase (ribokinase family)
VTSPGAIASLRAEDLPAGIFGAYGHFHVSSYYLQAALRPSLGELFAEARRAGLSTSLDPGYDPAEEWSGGLRETLREVDVFLPSESEIEGITGRQDVVEGLRALDNGHTLMVAKLGAQGCVALEGGSVVRVEAFPIEAVDTTGAGDSFDAGFLHWWLKGKALRECMEFGAVCGALSTRGLGGIEAQPGEAEAGAYMLRGVRDWPLMNADER